MLKTIPQKLAYLKQLYGTYEFKDEDYHVSEDVADFYVDSMFGYFRGELCEQQEARLLAAAQESKLLLHDLISLGESMLDDVGNSRDQRTTVGWMDISSSSFTHSTLAKGSGTRIALPAATMLAADSGQFSISTELTFDATAEVFEDNGQLVLRVSSRNESLDGQLVGYSLRGANDHKRGFLMLRGGVTKTVSGTARFDRKELAGDYALNVVPADASDLDLADFPLLHAAASADSNDARSISAWRHWIQDAMKSDDGPGLMPGLSALENALPVGL